MLGSHKIAATLDQRDTSQKEKGQARLDAEQEANSIIASAKQLAQETISQAKAQAEQIRTESTREKQKAISEVRGHIETILAAAREEAAKLVADARRKAEEEANDVLARARQEAGTLTVRLAKGPDNTEKGPVVGNAYGQGLPPGSVGEVHTAAPTRPSGTQSTAPPPDESVLYYGEVELRITVPPDGTAVRELENRLLAVAYLGVNRPKLSETGRVALAVNARAPTPLLRILRNLAVVKTAMPAGKDIEMTLHPRRKE